MLPADRQIMSSTLYSQTGSYAYRDDSDVRSRFRCGGFDGREERLRPYEMAEVVGRETVYDPLVVDGAVVLREHAGAVDFNAESLVCWEVHGRGHLRRMWILGSFCARCSAAALVAFIEPKSTWQNSTEPPLARAPSSRSLAMASFARCSFRAAR